MGRVRQWGELGNVESKAMGRVRQWGELGNGES